MNRIHVQIDELYRQLGRLKSLAWYMDEDIEQSERALKRLALVWDGAAADDFLQQARTCVRRLDDAFQEFRHLLALLESEIHQWEDLDRQGAWRWADSQRWKSAASFDDTT